MTQVSADSNNLICTESEIKLTSEQQTSLISHWDDAISLYKHTKEKLIYTTNLCRYNKLQEQMKEHRENDDNNNNDDEYNENLEWNYLLICISQLLKLNGENVSYHLLAIQIYQSHPIADRYNDNKYLSLALLSCDIGIKLCLLHLNGYHSSFYIWITTFYVLKAQILFQQRKWNKVIQCILPSLKYQQSDNIHLLYNLRASAYCELKQFHEAIADYGLAIDKSSEPSSYYNSRGTCYHELGSYDVALTDYNEAIKSNPKCVSAYNNRASLFVDMKEYKKALNDANEGLTIYENHGNLYKHRGLAHFYLKNYNQCLIDLQKSIKFAPKYRPARITLKMVWDFHYKHLIQIGTQINSFILNKDICIILIDYIVGNNYQTDDNMVDATYADWKKEMALIEQEKQKKLKKYNKNNNQNQNNQNNQNNIDINDDEKELENIIKD